MIVLLLLMMDTKKEIIKIWRECFPTDTQAWVDMYFTNAYREECAMTLTHDEATVCSLLLQPYSMTFHGERVGVSYVSGAATRPQFRNHGYMPELINLSLAESPPRVDMLSTLIRANSRLYFYYAKLGFATVFYNTVLRYTSAHTFPVEKYYAPVDTGNIDSLYDAFTRLMNDRNCCIQHNREQFETIQADNRLCDGMFTAIADEADGQIAAMAWAIPESGNRTMKVIDILARDEDSYNAVLRELQLLCPNKAITVMERPNDNGAVTLTPKGMARLVRPDQALTTVARKFPSLKSHIRVSDPILPENNAIYSLSDGEVKVLPYNSRSVELDLDITIEVLTAILFSSGHIGQIMGLPAERPFISLMLD